MGYLLIVQSWWLIDNRIVNVSTCMCFFMDKTADVQIWLGISVIPSSDHDEKGKLKGEKMKKMVAAMMLLLLISTQMESVKPDAADCIDGCTTGCVQRDCK
ncbi:hypothetical protein E2542_SST00026 [Spatholobus suberectus]|nr:hypothetical protein E2542_SST00026 [Spatholobus suberectus]